MAHIYNSQLDAFELYHHLRDDEDTTSWARAASTSGGASHGAAMPALGHALAGAIGSAISNVSTYPLDLIITRLQVQRQQTATASESSTATSTEKGPHRDNSIQDNAGAPDELGFQKLARMVYEKEGGLGAFYQGLLVDTGKTVADAFLFFLVYTFLRRRRIAARSVQGSNGSAATRMLSVGDELGIGFLAGSLTKLATMPISNIVTRKQTAAQDTSSFSGKEKEASSTTTAATSSPSKPPSIRQIGQDILKQKGIQGFWSGYSAALILTLNPTLTFFLFESLKRFLLPRSKRANPPATATFFLAALSKACASSVTYPFSVVKAKAQVASGESHPHNIASASVSTNASSLPPASSDPGSSSHYPPLSPSVSSPASPRRTYTIALHKLRNFNFASFTPTILPDLLTAIQTTGLRSLYTGLSLELMKSFLSHGITMLTKQRVHRVIVRLYYLLNLIASPSLSSRGMKVSELLQQQRQRGFEYYDLARRRAGDRLAGGQETTAGGDSKGGPIGRTLNEAVDLVADYIEDDQSHNHSHGDDQGLAGTGFISHEPTKVFYKVTGLVWRSSSGSDHE